jgi:pimeloyl-ACP methyl ester carboxylesterase
VLKLERVGVHDNFFELGGHSLSAIHVISEINRRFKVSVSVLELFKNPTVSQMRTLILGQQPFDKRRPTVVVLQDGQSQLPVYFIYAGVQELSLARAMGHDCQVFGIDVPWPLEWRCAVAANRTSDFPSMEQLVAPYVSALRAHAGSSPCVLAGYSLAGLMAFEAAHQFQRQGGKVAMVLLFDSPSKRPGRLLTAWNKVRRAWRTASVPPTSPHSPLMDYRYRLKGLSRWFWSRLQRRALSFFNRVEPNSPRLTGLLDEQSSFLEWEVMERLYGKMVKFYRPRRLAGRGVLIRADPIAGIEGADPTDRTRGWKNLFTEGLEIIPVVGDHHSMVHKHDPMLIRKINDLLKPH